jgi:hypothetical protein
MMNPSLQRQLARVQVENLHRAARGVSSRRTVALTDSRPSRTEATRLSAPVGRAIDGLVEASRDTRDEDAAGGARP